MGQYFWADKSVHLRSPPERAGTPSQMSPFTTELLEKQILSTFELILILK
ncbi:hypothetical protein [Nostoc sp.]